MTTTTRRKQTVSYTYGMYTNAKNTRTNIYLAIASAVIIGLSFTALILY